VEVDVAGANIFCAGFAHLQNGNILVAGGNADQDLNGLIQTHIFNWQTETWSRGQDMAAGRWYPAVAEMANGEEAIVGGGANTAEVYQNNGQIRQIPGFTDDQYGGRSYPFMTSRPDMQLGLIGPYDFIINVITSGQGVESGTDVRDGIDRGYGSFAPYDIGREPGKRPIRYIAHPITRERRSWTTFGSANRA